MISYDKDLIISNLEELAHVKVQITVHAEFACLLEDNSYEHIDEFLNSFMIIILNPSTFTAFFEQTVARLENIRGIHEHRGNGV